MAALYTCAFEALLIALLCACFAGWSAVYCFKNSIELIWVQGVANRDLKLENLLMDQDVNGKKPLLKICDFGYSKHEKYQSAPGSRVGTPAYLAPEVIMTTKGKTYDGKVCWCGVCARFG